MQNKITNATPKKADPQNSNPASSTTNHDATTCRLPQNQNPNQSPVN